VRRDEGGTKEGRREDQEGTKEGPRGLRREDKRTVSIPAGSTSSREDWNFLDFSLISLVLSEISEIEYSLSTQRTKTCASTGEEMAEIQICSSRSFTKNPVACNKLAIKFCENFEISSEAFTFTASNK
jgi:hypothetical protein